MHIDKVFEEEVDVEGSKVDIESSKVDIRNRLLPFSDEILKKQYNMWFC